MKSISLSSLHYIIYMEIRKIHSWQHASLRLMNHSGRRKGDYASSVLFNILQNVQAKDNVLNTSAITADTKSSMKPWNGATHKSSPMQ